LSWRHHPHLRAVGVFNEQSCSPSLARTKQIIALSVAHCAWDLLRTDCVEKERYYLVFKDPDVEQADRLV
jgi:hypothetical protein